MNLQKLYYDLPLPTSFSTADKLKLKYKGGENVQEWLNKQNVYSLHTPNRKKFVRHAIYVSGVDDTWQADLADMSL